MNKYYPGPAKWIANFIKIALVSFLLLASAAFFSAHAQGLVFQNPVLISQAAGKDGAIYRFTKVTDNVDALVKINGRSGSQVKLLNIDMTSTGFAKAFQPQVTYGDNNETSPGITDWWMEFGISFVKTGTTTPVSLTNFNLTALDIDGNGDKINEWVSLYGLSNSTVENNTLLSLANVLESLLGLTTLVGKKFSGPVTNYTNIDTTATRVMASAGYIASNELRLRTGGHSTGKSSSADRMYSFWFKSFSYIAPLQSTLPVKLSAFTAHREEMKAVLNWSTEVEKNVSHFAVQRSTDGVNFTDRSIIFVTGNTETHKTYSFTDGLATVKTGIVYYRLNMVDLDGHSEKSEVRIIKMNETATVSIFTYPNPVLNELRITLPGNWQGKPLLVEIYNNNSTIVKQISIAGAGHSVVLPVADLRAGVYVVKASSGQEKAVQQIVKVN